MSAMPSTATPDDEARLAGALDFQRVVVECTATVVVTVGHACAVEVTGTAPATGRVVVDRDEGVLRLSGALDAGDAIEVRITAPAVQTVSHRGTGRVEVEVDVTRRLDLVNHGDGLMVARGRVGVLRATLRGGGDMQLADLVASHAWLSNYGRGNLHAVVRATTRLDPVGPGAIKLNEHLKKPGRR